VNDAPALSAAQCGIAVDDATDAAKNAAAIILTSPGLSAIYSAVIESRRIFRKLKAYVTYRFAATIQIVFVLSLLIFVSNCPVNSLYVILLALFNDITMLPIAYDKQQASKTPETPEVYKMLMLAFFLGSMETAMSLFFAYGAKDSGLFNDDYDLATCDTTIQSAIWLQMSIAGELLIFSARAPSFMFTSISPSLTLVASVMAGCILTSVLAGASSDFGGLSLEAIALIWTYDLVGLLLIDACKVIFLRAFDENLEVIDESDQSPMVSHHDPSDILADSRIASVRMSAANERLSHWDSEIRKSRQSKGAGSESYRSYYSQDERAKIRPNSTDVRRDSTVSVTHSYGVSRSESITGRSSLVSGNLRPNTPGNKKMK
jgi:hypothetical protein